MPELKPAGALSTDSADWAGRVAMEIGRTATTDVRMSIFLRFINNPCRISVPIRPTCPGPDGRGPPPRYEYGCDPHPASMGSRLLSAAAADAWREARPGA